MTTNPRAMTAPMARTGCGAMTSPSDSALLAEVVDACLALPDLYPAITSLTDPPTTEEES